MTTADIFTGTMYYHLRATKYSIKKKAMSNVFYAIKLSMYTKNILSIHQSPNKNCMKNMKKRGKSVSNGNTRNTNILYNVIYISIYQSTHSHEKSLRFWML